MTTRAIGTTACVGHVLERSFILTICTILVQYPPQDHRTSFACPETIRHAHMGNDMLTHNSSMISARFGPVGTICIRMPPRLQDTRLTTRRI